MTLALALHSSHAAALAAKSRSLGEGARVLVELHESEPDVAAMAAIEVSALEARGILAGGAVERVKQAVEVGTHPRAEDIATLSRLEGLLNTAESRIRSYVGALDASESAAPVETLAGFIGLATGAISLVRSIF